GLDDHFRFVQTQIEELDEVVDGRGREGVDIIDVMLGQRLSLRRRNTFDSREWYCFARGDERAHLFGDFAFDLFFAADVDVPTDEFRSEAHVLTALANRQRELILVD